MQLADRPWLPSACGRDGQQVLIDATEVTEGTQRWYSLKRFLGYSGWL
jgi:hypothetical protein